MVGNFLIILPKKFVFSDIGDICYLDAGRLSMSKTHAIVGIIVTLFVILLFGALLLLFLLKGWHKSFRQEEFVDVAGLF